MKADRAGAEQRLAQLADEHGIEQTAERRVAVGDSAALLGRIASEEAADVIVVGARKRGWGRRGLESRLAEELETETPVPVLIAPPRTGARGSGTPQTRRGGANVAPWHGDRCRSTGASSPSTRAC